MNLSFHNKQMPMGLAPLHGLAVRRGRALAVAAVGVSGLLGFAGQALAQATPSTSGIGAQMNNMSAEAALAGGSAFSMGCYLAASVCFFFGVWAAWQSRQPQNREGGHVGRALAGLVLCGLFASAGVWIGKASQTASGGAATVTSTPTAMTFG